MKISLIAAMSKNGVIGRQGTMPWHVPADLKHFKALTMGKPLIMGRKTYESIGKPLPGRRMIVVTHNVNYQAPGCDIVHSLQEALAVTESTGDCYPEYMIAGGGEIYRQALPIANHLYLTFIDLTVEGDTYFPEWLTDVWEETGRSTHPAEGDTPGYVFVALERDK